MPKRGQEWGLEFDIPGADIEKINRAASRHGTVAPAFRIVRGNREVTLSRLSPRGNIVTNLNTTTGVGSIGYSLEGAEVIHRALRRTAAHP